MKNKLYFIFLYIVIAMFCAGCWSRTEPKNLSLVNSVLFDVKEDGSYQLTKEILNPSGNSGGKVNSGGISPELNVCEGKTIADAVRDELNGKALFGGNLKVRIFTEKFAKMGMVPALDYLSRDHLTDESSFMAVIKGEQPQLVYSSVTGLSESVGNYIDELSKTQPKIKSEAIFITTLEFIKDYYTDGKQPVAGLIQIEKNDSNSGSKSGTQDTKSNSSKEYKIVYSGLAAFKDDKLVGYMNAVETRAYNMVINAMKSATISLTNGLTTAKVLKCKSDIKIKIENGQTTISVDNKVALSVIQDGGNINVNAIQPLKKLEQRFDKQIETEIMASIKKAQQEFKSDIFGFGTYVHIQHPNEWKDMKTNWDDIFSRAKVNVTVKATIVMSGEIKNSFEQEK